MADIVYLYLLVDLFFYLFFICHSSAACIEIPPAIHRLTTCQSGTDRDAKGVCECVCVLLCVCVERNWRQQVKFRVHSACLIELSCCLVSKQCPASQMSGLVTWVRLRFSLCEYVCVCVSVCVCVCSLGVCLLIALCDVSNQFIETPDSKPTIGSYIPT